MDLQNLISCIQCHDHTNQIEVILETFKTIVQICHNESEGKDAFREEGGLDFLMEFLSKTDSSAVLEHSLKTLAVTVDQNIPNQMHMTKHSVFKIIKAVLLKENFDGTIHKNALLLLSAIMYQNNAAQILLYETEVLQDLVSLYKHIFPTLSMNSSYSIPNMEEESVEFWLRLNSTLCFAVNNPQNEKNQEICCVLFSPCLSILETSLNNIIIVAVCSFLSLCISNNDKNQDYFYECDGLLTLKRCFQKHYEFLLLDAEECNNIIGKGTLQTLNSLVGIISAAVTNHEKNAFMLGKIGLVSLMINLLFIDTLDIQFKTRLYLSLGHCVDASCNNKSFILETNNFDALLKKNLETNHDELSSACKYLLQVCILNTGNKEILDSKDKPSTSNSKNKMSSASSLFSEKSFLNKVPEFEGFKHRPNNPRSPYNSHNHPPDSPCDIKMYLLSKTQGNNMESLKSSKTKGNNGMMAKATAKRPLRPPNSSQSVSTDDQNSKKTFSVFNSASEISFSPSSNSIRKKRKTSHTFSNFSSRINSPQRKLKKKRSSIDVHSSKGMRNPSNNSFSLEKEADDIKKSLESLDELKENIKSMNESLSQIFSSFSSSNNPTINQNLSEGSSMFGMTAADSLMPRSKLEFSTAVSNSALGGASTSKFHTDQAENCVFQDNISEGNYYCPSLKGDQNQPFNFCIGDFKVPSDKCFRSNLHSPSEFSEHSTITRGLRDFTFEPNKLRSSHTEVDSGRISSNPSFSHLEGQGEPSENVPDSNLVKVLVFPWKTCHDHGLISSFEMLQVVSIEDEDEY